MEEDQRLQAEIERLWEQYAVRILNDDSAYRICDLPGISIAMKLLHRLMLLLLIGLRARARRRCHRCRKDLSR